jgi:hypothetical protein
VLPIFLHETYPRDGDAVDAGGRQGGCVRPHIRPNKKYYFVAKKRLQMVWGERGGKQVALVDVKRKSTVVKGMLMGGKRDASVLRW